MSEVACGSPAVCQTTVGASCSRVWVELRMLGGWCLNGQGIEQLSRLIEACNHAGPPGVRDCLARHDWALCFVPAAEAEFMTQAMTRIAEAHAQRQPGGYVEEQGAEADEP